MQDKIDAIREHLARVEDLNAAAAVLEWDQETYMPAGAAEARAQQISTLRRLAHEHFTTEEVGRLLDELAPQVDGLDPLSDVAALVRVTRRDYEKKQRLSGDLVAALAEAVARAKQAWKAARSADDYALFQPHLQRLVDLTIEKAEALGYEERRYDALLDQYEPGMTTSEVDSVFVPLREELVPLVEAMTGQDGPDASFLRRSFDPQAQWDFGVEVIRALGYDFHRGRQDRSAHPFTTTFSVSDVRLTTRIDEHFLPTGLFGTMHEAGHGMYEQGVDPALDRTPLADGTSLGMHESQSRLWENQVGRSRAFWRHYYPRLREHFPDVLDDVSPERFYRGVNRVQPSLIRVEADEVTYNLHIMLRFELEKAMIEEEIDLGTLPERWNSLMEEYLGLRPPNDANGVLQDIHWSLGAFGYFPTYALGTLMAAQLYDAVERDLNDLEGQIGRGEFGELLGWLRTHIHQYGRKRTAAELLGDATGSPLQAKPWLDYVRYKYGEIYALRTTEHTEI